jgi:hypothetical protein
MPLLSLSFAIVIIVTTTALSVTAADFAAQCCYRRCRLCRLPPSFQLPLPPLPSLSFATIISIAAAAITVFAAAASSRSASNIRPHLVNPFRQWTYYPKAPCP